MAKAFANIKKSLGLLDFFTFGKYANCRVDSIVDMDDDYLRYMHKTGMKFDAEVINALSVKFNKDSTAINKANDDALFDDKVIMKNEYYDLDDLPF